jgi:hypothetical protein
MMFGKDREGVSPWVPVRVFQERAARGRSIVIIFFLIKPPFMNPGEGKLSFLPPSPLR